jgi:CxxC motif-containing protein (DUF1111 family)
MPRSVRRLVSAPLTSVLVTALASVSGCGDDSPESIAPGGATTISDRTSNAYSFPAPNLDAAELELHLLGDAAFEAAFVTAPATVNPGLGPLYNHTNCDGCHRRDGRGLPQLGNGPTSQALVRVSLPSGIPRVPGGPVAVPGFGTQLQDHAVFGFTPEVRLTLAWDEEVGNYQDGGAYSLRRPRLSITDAEGRALPSQMLTSLRIGPPMFGRGLLEAIDAATLESLADPSDADGDGIAGRINSPWDELRGESAIGRFGQKANTPTLQQQVAAAYANDMGVSNPMFPDSDGRTDIDAATVDSVTFYLSTLAVPARADSSPAAERGEALFDDMGCARCHVPSLVTGDHAIPALAQQRIWPYSDLLLHDMGEGLADGRPDFAATGSQWRTAPLWGIGLVQTVSPGAGYLHDGRARTFAEAILWHGGEAQSAREAFRSASRSDREALLAFLAIL